MVPIPVAGASSDNARSLFRHTTVPLVLVRPFPNRHRLFKMRLRCLKYPFQICKFARPSRTEHRDVNLLLHLTILLRIFKNHPRALSRYRKDTTPLPSTSFGPSILASPFINEKSTAARYYLQTRLLQLQEEGMRRGRSEWAVDNGGFEKYRWPVDIRDALFSRCVCGGR